MGFAGNQSKGFGKCVRACGGDNLILARIIHSQFAFGSFGGESGRAVEGLQVVEKTHDFRMLFGRGVLDGGADGRRLAVVALQDGLEIPAGQQEDRLVQPWVMCDCRDSEDATQTGADEIQSGRVNSRA